MNSEIAHDLKHLAALATKIAEHLNREDDETTPVDTDDPIREDALKPRSKDSAAKAVESQLYKIRPKVKCQTESRGFATPDNRSPTRLVLDAPDGFIPLWTSNVTLRWRFNAASMSYFQNVDAAKDAIRKLMTKAIKKWGDAAPVRFAEQSDSWDFEIFMKSQDDCDGSGCTLAEAFFPDAGRHKLYLYPKMFEQSKKEQVETLIHELGHVFGLRHFFALIDESAWPSVVFGTHEKFTIMNYGTYSELTDADRSDLKSLYESVWSGALTNINGTPVRLVKPYHDSGAMVLPRAIAAYQNLEY